MPQIDFGHALSTPDEVAPSPGHPHSVPAAPAENPGGIAPPRFRSRLGRSDWTNILFTIIAVLGGLFCAFYFFNGAELLRSAADWPREFLYSRPFAFTNVARIDNFRSPEATPADPRSTSSSDQGPFGRSARPLQGLDQSPSLTAAPTGTTAGASSPSSPSSPSAPPAFNPGSLLGQLGFPAPGGDALSQTFNKAVADLQQAAALNARRTVVVVQTAASRTKQRAAATLKNTTQTAQSTVANLSGQQLSQQNSTAAAADSRTAAAQTQATNSLRSTMSAGRSSVGGLGAGRTGLGSGSLGGLGGGLRGALGGGRGGRGR